MAKDPAVLFYTSDFITGTMAMNFEDKGKYITLLCMQHQHGRIPEETIRFIVGSVSDNLKVKFRIDENGKWYNERMEEETIKRANFTKSRRENGQKGGRPGSKNEEEPNEKKFIPPTYEQVEEVFKESGYLIEAQQFYTFYESKNWMVGKNKMKNWRSAAAGWIHRTKKKDGTVKNIRVVEYN